MQPLDGRREAAHCSGCMRRDPMLGAKRPGAKKAAAAPAAEPAPAAAPAQAAPAAESAPSPVPATEAVVEAPPVKGLGIAKGARPPGKRNG